MEENNKLKEELIKKLDEEYKKFLEELREEPFETIIEKSYEIMSKQEIKDYIEYQNLDERKIKALLKQDEILEDFYDEWLGADGNFYSAMEYILDDRIKELTEEYSKKLNKNNRER